MLEISVNGLTRWAPSSPENWGELLNLLENDDESGRHVVTAVRFGGVEVPTFRAPWALDADLGAVGRIDVQASSVDELLRESARAAGASIGPLKSATRRVAGRLRSGDEMAALRDLPQLTASIQILTTVTSGLAGAIDVAARRGDLEALVLHLCRLVDGIITRQGAADWTGVADLLERDFVPTFDAWLTVARRAWKLA